MRLLLCAVLLVMPAWAQVAGRVTRSLPEASIIRGTQTQDAPAQTNVQFNDVIKTQNAGRARVVLRDGSILNVSENASLKVLQYDAQSQQTKLQLDYGYVRANVAKLVNPNSSFEIHTNTVVCGVLGTHFEVETSDEATQVHVHEGQVSFTNKKTGQKMTVPKGGSMHLLHKSGQFRRGMFPKFAAHARERWKNLPKESAEEAEDRRQEMQRLRQEERQAKQQEKQKEREQKKGKGGGKRKKG